MTSASRCPAEDGEQGHHYRLNDAEQEHVRRMLRHFDHWHSYLYDEDCQARRPRVRRFYPPHSSIDAYCASVLDREIEPLEDETRRAYRSTTGSTLD